MRTSNGSGGERGNLGIIPMQVRVSSKGYCTIRELHRTVHFRPLTTQTKNTRLENFDLRLSCHRCNLWIL